MNTSVCPHPPARRFAWHAYDGTLCVGCCDCGEVLAGAATLAALSQGDHHEHQMLALQAAPDQPGLD